jgi:hypothetical protein
MTNNPPLPSDYEMVRDLHRHAFDDCGAVPPVTHIAVQAATALQSKDAKILALRSALKAVEPYLDAIICYASTMDEHEPNRIAFNVRKALSDTEGEG